MKKIALMLSLVLVSAFSIGCIEDSPEIMFSNSYSGCTINSVSFAEAEGENIGYLESTDYISGTSGTHYITYSITCGSDTLSGTTTESATIEDGEKYEVNFSSSGWTITYGL